PTHPGVMVETDVCAWPSVLAAFLRDGTALDEIGRSGRRCIERELNWQQIGDDLVRHARTWQERALPATPAPAAPSKVWLPRWLADHATHDALADPQTTGPGRPRWLRHQADTNLPAAAHRDQCH